MAEQLFISDLHLSAERPVTLARFLAFLRERTGGITALYILGDLFDAWIGDDDDSPLAHQVRRGLQQVTDRGVEVLLQHGNRDFLLGEQFCAATGCRLLEEATVIDLHGQTTLLMHGDLLCTDDRDYQQARGRLRSPAFVQDFLSRPLPERVALAAEYRKRSGEATSLKASEIMDVNEHAVIEYLQRHQATRLIHGHTHRQGRHRYAAASGELSRVVLGEWHARQGSVLVASATALAFERT